MDDHKRGFALKKTVLLYSVCYGITGKTANVFFARAIMDGWQ